MPAGRFSPNRVTLVVHSAVMTSRGPFIRYIATYIVVLLIPIVLIVLVFRVNLLTQLRAEAEIRLALEADATIERLHDELRQISNISYQVGQSADFISFRIANPLTAIEAQQTLFVANFTNDLIEELAYFPRDAAIVYASNSPYSPQTFFTSVLSIDPNSQERLADAVDTGRGRRFLSLNGRHGTRAVFLVDSVPHTDGYHRGVLVYLLSSSQLVSEVHSLWTWDNASVKLSADGELLLSSGALDKTSERVLTERRSIPEYGVLLEFSVSERILLRGYNRAILVLAGAVGIAVLMSIPLIYLFSARHYRPVAEIEQFLHRTFRVHPDERQLGKIVEEQVQALLDERNTLSGQLNASSQLVVRELLVKLFRGSIQPVDRFVSLCNEYGLSIEERALTVVIVAFSCERSEEDAREIERLVSTGTDGDCQGYLELGSNQFSMLLSRPAQVRDESVVARLNRLLHNSLLTRENRIAVGVGSTVTDASLVSQSYVEARSALEHRYIHGMNKLFSFEEIYRVERSKYEYPVAKLARLQVLVRTIQPQLIPQLLAEIFASVREQSPPLSVARMVSFDCANTMIRAAATALPGRQKELWELIDALSLARIQTLEEIEEHMRAMSQRLCELLSSVASAEQKESIGDLIRFIEAHAYERDFSAHTVADYSGKSLSSFSHHFRAQMGMTFREYLNQLRMSAAVEMLSESDKPVGVIVHAVGYSDATSFIRKFKKEHGVTPSQFRKRTRNDRSPGS